MDASVDPRVAEQDSDEAGAGSNLETVVATHRLPFFIERPFRTNEAWDRLSTYERWPQMPGVS
jgi:hypothetical protein